MQEELLTEEPLPEENEPPSPAKIPAARGRIDSRQHNNTKQLPAASNPRLTKEGKELFNSNQYQDLDLLAEIEDLVEEYHQKAAIKFAHIRARYPHANIDAEDIGLDSESYGDCMVLRHLHYIM